MIEKLLALLRSRVVQTACDLSTAIDLAEEAQRRAVEAHSKAAERHLDCARMHERAAEMYESKAAERHGDVVAHRH